MSSPHDPPSQPGMRPVAPARRSTDAYMAVGFAGVALLGFVMAAVLVVVPEPTRPYHLWFAAAVAAASTLPAVAAVGTTYLLLAQRHRRKIADQERNRWKRM